MKPVKKGIFTSFLCSLQRPIMKESSFYWGIKYYFTVALKTCIKYAWVDIFFLMLIYQDYNFVFLLLGQINYASFGHRNLTIVEYRTAGFWHHKNACEDNVPFCILRNSDFDLSFASNLKLLLLRLRYCCLVESDQCWIFKGMERFNHVRNTYNLTKILTFVRLAFRQIVISVCLWKLQYCTVVSINQQCS